MGEVRDLQFISGPSGLCSIKEVWTMMCKGCFFLWVKLALAVYTTCALFITFLAKGLDAKPYVGAPTKLGLYDFYHPYVGTFAMDVVKGSYEPSNMRYRRLQAAAWCCAAYGLFYVG
jgi:hypothetical protein